ncbi:MAG TPA: hypothetical protein VLM80_01580 [Anaerolineales bacterium]|nr:hypothetical protein [Anaerolineales bacterium]
MIKLKFTCQVSYLIQAILCLGMVGCQGNPAATIPHPTELSTTPFPENSQPGGLEGIYISTISIAGAQPERCYKLYRFYQDGLVIYADFTCFEPSSNARTWAEIDRWFTPKNQQVLQGDYHIREQRIWIRVVGYDAVHEETYLRSFQGAHCNGQLVLQEPTVKIYSGVPSEITQPVLEYIKLQNPSSAQTTPNSSESASCRLAGFRFISRPLAVVDGGEALFQVQTNPGQACTLQYTTPGGLLSLTPGTGAITADQRGICEWKWEVGPEEGPATVNISIGHISQDLELNIR